MQGIVLAAGRGTRLGADVPKGLPRVAGVQPLRLLIGNMADAGIDDIVVVAGHRCQLVVDAVESWQLEATVNVVLNNDFDRRDTAWSFAVGAGAVSKLRSSRTPTPC